MFHVVCHPQMDVPRERFRQLDRMAVNASALK
jgi:hypothetical protein